MSNFNAYKIVGFDVRKPPILDLGTAKGLGDYCPTDWPVRQPYPPTISEQTWPRSAKCDSIDYPETNGVNLLWLPDAQILDREAISVAFSLRAKDAEVFEAGSWVLPIDEGYLNKKCRWQLLGYDVADSWLAFSGFYGFTWKQGEMARVFDRSELVFNRHGLLDEEESAVLAAEVFRRDKSTESHGPFYPVRVWVQSPEAGTQDVA